MTPTAGELACITLGYAFDSAGHNASTDISLDINPGISSLWALLAPAPRSPWAPTFHFKPWHPVFYNPSFALSDSFGGSTATSNNLFSGGYFSWTPVNGDVGTHEFTVTVTDSSGHLASAKTSITVSAATAVAPTINTPAISSSNNGLSFTSYLHSSSTGAEVTALQNVLKQQGFFSGTATGYFGL